MARKKLTTVEETKELRSSTLKDLIDSYGKLKDEINSLDKVAKSQNASIKEQIKEAVTKSDNKYICAADDYEATLTLQDASTMNEEKLIEFLKKHNLAKGIVKKREYIDTDAFESAKYKGTISDELLLEMESCIDAKVIEKLTIKKVKKGD